MNTTVQPQTRNAFTVVRPQFSTSFVAVETSLSKRPAAIFVGGAPATQPVFPEVIVTAYARATVKQVTEGRNGNVRVVIDAASIVTQNGGQLKHDIHLNTGPNTDCAWYARQAHEAGTEVFFAFEQRRKTKNTETGEYIPFTTPIRTLAGITEGTSRQDQKAAADNLSKGLVAIGPADHIDETYLSSEARCDPTQWSLFSSNHDGTQTPPAFIRPTDADGSPLGCLIRAIDAPATAHRGKNAVDSATTVDDRRLLRTAGGGINPGSAAVAAAAVARRRARQAVRSAFSTDQDATADQKRHAVEQLTRVLLWLADRVQHEVTGDVDRTTSSYEIAADQVDEAMEFDLPYHVELATDQDLARQWASEVRELAVSGLQEAVAATETWANAQG